MPITKLKTENAFPPAGRFVGYTLMTIALLVTIPTKGIGLILIGAVGGFLTYTFKGVEFNQQTNSFRQYSSIFGIKTYNPWFTFEAYPDITIFNSKETGRVYSRSMHYHQSEDSFYKLYLLSSNHLKKIMIKKCKSKEEAKQLVEQLKQEFQLNYTKYNPQNSRRRR